MHVIGIMRLSNVKARDHLMPIIESSMVERVTLIRHAPLAIESSKLTQVIHAADLDEGAGHQKLFARIKNLWLCFYNGVKAARGSSNAAVVAFNFVPYGLIAWAVARVSGSRVIIGLIGTDFNLRLQTGVAAPLLRVILRNCDAVTIFGEEARQILISWGMDERRVHILPHAIDTDRYQPDASAEVQADLIYVGFLRKLKRLDRLLRAMQVVTEQRPNTTLWIVGDGLERHELESMAESLGITQQVRFLGWSANPVQQLRQAHVYISLSDYEGLPMAIIEAMCVGLPVITTDIGAISTVVHDGINGYLVPPDDDVRLVADRILTILANPERLAQMREAALAIRERHTYRYASATWDVVIKEIS